MAKRKKSNVRAPRCVIIAGPNGAGKSTFAMDFLPREMKIVHFVNADLIAGGLSPLNPRLADVSASRIFLAEIERLVSIRASFAFESTLSGLSYLPRMKSWKASGYIIEIVYLSLPTVELAIERVSLRVKQGGHFVSEEDIRRRFKRSWKNFQAVYRVAVDAWTLYDGAGSKPKFIASGS